MELILFQVGGQQEVQSPLLQVDEIQLFHSSYESILSSTYCDPVTICHDTKVMFREHNTPSILPAILLLLHQRDHWDMWLQ